MSLKNLCLRSPRLKLAVSFSEAPDGGSWLAIKHLPKKTRNICVITLVTGVCSWVWRALFYLFSWRSLLSWGHVSVLQQEVSKRLEKFPPTCGHASCGRKAELMWLTAVSVTSHRPLIPPFSLLEEKGERHRLSDRADTACVSIYQDGLYVALFPCLEWPTSCGTPRSVLATIVLKVKSILLILPAHQLYVCLWGCVCIFIYYLYLSRFISKIDQKSVPLIMQSRKTIWQGNECVCGSLVMSQHLSFTDTQDARALLKRNVGNVYLPQGHEEVWELCTQQTLLWTIDYPGFLVLFSSRCLGN